MEIEILNTHKNDFSPVIGERTMELLSRFGQKLDEDGIDTLSSETIEILSHCTNPYKNEVQSVTNLVVGKVVKPCLSQRFLHLLTTMGFV